MRKRRLSVWIKRLSGSAGLKLLGQNSKEMLQVVQHHRGDPDQDLEGGVRGLLGDVRVLEAAVVFRGILDLEVAVVTDPGRKAGRDIQGHLSVQGRFRKVISKWCWKIYHLKCHGWT